MKKTIRILGTALSTFLAGAVLVDYFSSGFWGKPFVKKSGKLEQEVEKAEIHKKEIVSQERKTDIKEDKKPKLILIRKYRQTSTIGELYKDNNEDGIVDTSDEKLCDTLELAWKDNKRNISCIPEGEYSTIPRRRGKYSGRGFELLNTLGRTEILIHSGNTLRDTSGCILVGTKKECETGDYLNESRNILSKLKKSYPSGFDLSIRN